MPTISKIMPNGNGDFTTLQAWEDFADDQGSADQWAECYKGGDLGEVTLSGWAATPTVTDYPRIYTPFGQRHTGYYDASKAKISLGSGVGVDILINYVRVEGLQIRAPVGTDKVGIESNGTGVLIDGNLIILGTANNFSTGIFVFPSGSAITATVRNNISIGPIGSGVAGLRSVDPGGVGMTVEWYNNTSLGWIFAFLVTGSGVDSHTISNDICMDSGSGDFTNSGTSITASNNMSSDDTADDFGGSGHKINESSSDQFQNSSEDWRLKTDSEAIDAGTTIGSFSSDAIHGDGWRPRGDAWDMGALEGVPRKIIQTPSSKVGQIGGGKIAVTAG